MSEVTLTPERQSVFNVFDRFGLLLGLPRLRNERNPAYKQRLMDVFANRANSSYKGLINGITRELGLSITNVMTIIPTRDGNNDLVGDNPVVKFEETKCYIYSDFSDLSAGLHTTLDRFERDGNAYNLEELQSSINNTGLFTATLDANANSSDRSMTIFNQTNYVTVASEDLSTGAAVIRLDNQNLISGTIVIRSSNLTEEVSLQSDLKKAGQYYIDYLNGIIYTTEAPFPGSSIRYIYRNNNFVVKASPVIIHNLNSTDFRTKMFEQILGSDGTYTDGVPTSLGVDLIAELMSVYPAALGR